MCIRDRHYVDEYLHLQGVFVLITKQWVNNSMRNRTRLLYIIKREGTKFETSLSISKPFPMLDQRSIQNRKSDLYPLLTPSNETQGSLIFEVHSSSYFTHSSAAKLALDLYRFDVEKCNWKLLKRKYANIKSRVISCTPISDSTLLMFLSSRHEHKGYRLKLISINICTTPKSFLGVFTGDGQRRIKIPKEVEQLNGFSLVNLTNDSILLIGGRYFRGSRCSGPSEPNRVIWQGTLADKNTKMEWDRIDLSLIHI